MYLFCLTDKFKKKIESGNLIVVIHGRLTYEDVFGVGHWFQFCSFGSAGSLKKRGSAKCDEYNDTDNNE